MTTLADIEFEIIKLELKPGDTLAIKTDQPLVAMQVKQIREAAEKFVPAGVKVMVISSGFLPEMIKAD